MQPISDYDYELPPELIAQTPIEPRDYSRLLILDRQTSEITHRHFYDIGDYLQAGDLLIVNDSRVLPARLYGVKDTGGKIEALLLRQHTATRWEALLKGKVHPGSSVSFSNADNPELMVTAQVIELLDDGTRMLEFSEPINEHLQHLGSMPLPPYISETLADPERYQTVYSNTIGSAAAPTAGLHWTPERIEHIKRQGIEWASVTLHVGLDTFRPVQVDHIQEHTMHSEWYHLPQGTADAINRTRQRGGRIIAVGTTSVRVLETIGQRQQNNEGLIEQSGWTSIFIYPPYSFTLVDGLITNFHLPKSTLLLLVSSLTDRNTLLNAYKIAVTEGYRFFSFGDAMLIL